MKDLQKNPTISDMQNHLMEYIRSQGWDDKTDTEVFLMFVEEIGELAKEIRRKHKLDAEANVQEETEGEFADVLNYLLELAYRMDVDLETAYRNKMQKNLERTWPNQA